MRGPGLGLTLLKRPLSASGTAPPSNTVAPVISGTVTEDQTLSCTTGTWTGSPSSYAYQWKRDGVDIGGATASTYVLVAADVGANMTCVVTATNGGGSTPATSNTLGPVISWATATVDDWITRVVSNSGTVSATIRTAKITLVQAFRDLGIWNNILRMNLMVGDQLAAALVPLKVGSGSAVDTNNNFVSGDYTLAGGLASDGSFTKYLNTGFNFGTVSTAGLSVWLKSSSSSTRSVMGGVSGLQGIRLYRSSGYNGYIGLLATNVVTHTYANGLASLRRASATDLKWFRNGVEQASNTTLETGTTSTQPLYTHCYNNNGSMTGAGSHQMAGYSCNDGLIPDSLQDDIYNAWAAFHTAIGR